MLHVKALRGHLVESSLSSAKDIQYLHARDPAPPPADPSPDDPAHVPCCVTV